MAILRIYDDFDLQKIADSGQAFRIKSFESGFFRFVCGPEILYIRHISGDDYEIRTFDASGTKKTDEDKWENVWKKYFDFSRDYAAIRKSVPRSDEFLKKACENGKGLRILRQDPWEMIISFIISQRKSIPAIKSSIEDICTKYGKSVRTGFEEIYLFPSPSDMQGASGDDLKNCKLGYRVPYIEDAVKRVLLADPDPYKLYDLEYESLFSKLKEIKGIGDKVANCICLFAYAKTEAAPVDTWIAKVIEKYYNGKNPFPAYGNSAGIMQQYIFYYALTHKFTVNSG